MICFWRNLISDVPIVVILRSDRQIDQLMLILNIFITRPCAVTVNSFVPSAGTASISTTKTSKFYFVLLMFNSFGLFLNHCLTFCHFMYSIQELGLSLFFLSRNPTPSLFNDKYTFCDKCFNDIQGDTVALTDDPSAPQTWVSVFHLSN
jgi:hypothetical protein